MKKNSRVLGTFTLAMITMAAIVSLRNLPLTAELGTASIFFLCLGALVFFIPISLVTAELAAAWPQPGGCYVWVSKAFNKPLGFFTLWMAWMESIAWFPAILAFTASMFAHLLTPMIPGLEDNTWFMVIAMLSIFWGATFCNFLGIEISGWISSVGVVLGTLIPGGLIIGFGLWWIFSGQPTQIALTWEQFIPKFELDNIVIFSGVLLGLAGVELAAFHIREAKDPQKQYPRALGLAAILILIVYIFGTLSIAVVVPQKDISLASGLIQALQVFFQEVGLIQAVPLLALFLLLGSLAGINAWTVGPAKGMLIAAKDGFLPKWLTKENKKGVPTALLMMQATIGSILAMVFLYLDDNSLSIWILIALSAQFTFVQYILVFFSALRLRSSRTDKVRAFKAPFLPAIVLLGVGVCVFCFFLVYIPPAQLGAKIKQSYNALLVISFIVLSILPMLLAKMARKTS